MSIVSIAGCGSSVKYRGLAVLLFLITSLWVENLFAIYEWSFQQRLVVGNVTVEDIIVNDTIVGNFSTYGPETYGITPPLLQGRGFITLISGYDDSGPGVFVHTTDEGSVVGGHVVWSQQATLVPSDWREGDSFGRNMAGYGETLVVASPHAQDNRGYVYIYNGTNRAWSQIQRLVALEGTPGDYFGDSLSLHEDRMIIGARGTQFESGAAYVYERDQGRLTWSRQAKLLPRDLGPGQQFAQQLSLYGETVAITAKNDEFSGTQTGSTYIYTGSGSSWSQQQKLIALDFQNLKQEDEIALEFLDLSFGQRMLGPSVVVNQNKDILVGITMQENITNRESVYIWKPTDEVNSWSLQQRLFMENDTYNETIFTANLYMDALRGNTLVATTPGPNITASYVFRTFGDGWSLQQRLTSYNASEEPPAGIPRRSITDFSNPALWGGHLLYRAGNEVHIRSKFANDSCLLLWMSDHFLDGWDSAVLTVRAPDLTNDTFHPHCDQVDPFVVRYCPYQPEDEGVYIIKVFAALEARFYWELSWRVMIEATGVWYKGDFSTKMMFNFNATSTSWSIVEIQNEIDLEAPCYRCTRIATRSWAQLQEAGPSSFFPLVVTGAPYYISDYQGRNISASGKVCDGVIKYECYQTIQDGIYILRLGGGLFGRLTGFPYRNASWEGCGETGGLHDQFVFRIANGQCTPLQKFTYTSRCSRPSMIDVNAFSSTRAPTAGGTVAPTQSVFGPEARGRERFIAEALPSRGAGHPGQGQGQGHNLRPPRQHPIGLGGSGGGRSASSSASSTIGLDGSWSSPELEESELLPSMDSEGNPLLTRLTQDDEKFLKDSPFQSLEYPGRHPTDPDRGSWSRVWGDLEASPEPTMQPSFQPSMQPSISHLPPEEKPETASADVDELTTITAALSTPAVFEPDGTGLEAVAGIAVTVEPTAEPTIVGTPKSVDNLDGDTISSSYGDDEYHESYDGGYDGYEQDAAHKEDGEDEQGSKELLYAARQHKHDHVYMP